MIDRTGIPGIFDFELKWVNQPTGNAEDVSFLTAVQEQLGLKLEPGNAPGGGAGYRSRGAPGSELTSSRVVTWNRRKLL